MQTFTKNRLEDAMQQETSISRREENIIQLEKRFPQISERIEERKEQLLEEEAMDIFWEQAYTGEPILRIQKDGRLLYLAGKREPAAHAENQVSLLGRIVPNAPIIIVGMGNLHYLEKVLEASPDSVQVLLYEPSFTIFWEQLGKMDVEKLFGKSLIALIVRGINDDNIKPLITTLLSGDKIPLLKQFILPNYEQLFPEEIKGFYQPVRDFAGKYQINFNTERRFNDVLAKNVYHNVKHIKSGYTAGQLEKALPKNIPAIVISAGPSLNKNIMELKKAKGRAFLIACDTAIKPLLKAGIVPDMYAMLDAKKEASLVEVEEAREIPLIALAVGSQKIFDYHTGKKFFVNEGISFIGEMFALNHKGLEFLPVGGSVATLAFSLVCHLGFDTVILVGQDLAFTGNKSHADGTFAEKMEETDTSDFLMVEGNYEEKVPTRYDFDAYRKWFNDFIAYWNTIRKVRFINATEGGAKIEGTEILTLKEAIEQECHEAVDIAACLEKLEPVFNDDEQKKIEAYFQKTPARIHMMISQAKEARKAYVHLEKLCSHGNMDKKAYVKILKKIKKTRKAIEANENYSLLEETMIVAEQIIRSGQHFEYGSVEEEGLELARQGKLYMEYLTEYATLLEQLAKDTVGKSVTDQDGSTDNESDR